MYPFIGMQRALQIAWEDRIDRMDGIIGSSEEPNPRRILEILSTTLKAREPDGGRTGLTGWTGLQAPAANQTPEES
jgi:hypothetical protein